MSQSVNKIALLFAFNATCVLLFPAIGLVDLSVSGALIAYAVLFLMNGLGVIVGYHRHLSHGAFEFKNEALRRLFLFLGAVSCSGSPLGWAVIHKTHHRYSDRDGDPHHSDIGLIKMQAVRYDMEKVCGFAGVRKIMQDPFCNFLHRHYFAVVAVAALSIFALFGVTGLYWGFILPAALTMFAENFLNWAAHKNWGYQNHNAGDRSKNVWWLNFLSFGEGWHNNHHKNPKSQSTKERWFEFDPAGLVIAAVKT
jgi:fatty-acid desaturase